MKLSKTIKQKLILIATVFLVENYLSILPSSDDIILEFDVDYAKETLNRNLLKRLEIAW